MFLQFCNFMWFCSSFLHLFCDTSDIPSYAANVHHLYPIQVLCQMGNAPQAIQYFLKALTFSEARHHDHHATEAKISLALTQYQLEMPNQVPLFF